MIERGEGSFIGTIHRIAAFLDGKIDIETSSASLSIHEITHVRQSPDSMGLSRERLKRYFKYGD